MLEFARSGIYEYRVEIRDLWIQEVEQGDWKRVEKLIIKIRECLARANICNQTKSLHNSMTESTSILLHSNLVQKMPESYWKWLGFKNVRKIHFIRGLNCSIIIAFECRSSPILEPQINSLIGFVVRRRHDIRHNNILYNDIHHNNIQHNGHICDTRTNDIQHHGTQPNDIHPNGT